MSTKVSGSLTKLSKLPINQKNPIIKQTEKERGFISILIIISAFAASVSILVIPNIILSPHRFISIGILCGSFLISSLGFLCIKKQMFMLEEKIKNLISVMRKTENESL